MGDAYRVRCVAPAKRIAIAARQVDPPPVNGAATIVASKNVLQGARHLRACTALFVLARVPVTVAPLENTSEL